jgi:iron complex outermembrane recepter protein
MVRKFALLATASLIFVATPAFAQDSSVAADDTGGLEEIVVTAQKREQNLQDVPVSVTPIRRKRWPTTALPISPT